MQTIKYTFADGNDKRNRGNGRNIFSAPCNSATGTAAILAGVAAANFIREFNGTRHRLCGHRRESACRLHTKRKYGTSKKSNSRPIARTASPCKTDILRGKNHNGNSKGGKGRKVGYRKQADKNLCKTKKFFRLDRELCPFFFL